MKFIFLFFIIMVLGSPSWANFLQEQKISTSEQDCSIHYLTVKPKKLWTIEVDKNYCKNGFVQGFAPVILKDALNRTIETLHGFFYQGYWLSDFVEPIGEFYRAAVDENIQDFIFKTGADADLDLNYYLVARATRLQDHYTAFNICTQTSILLVSHEPTDDFKESVFQNEMLKKAQQHFLTLCPKAQKLQILGISNEIPDLNKAFLQADLDLEEESITLSYRMPFDKKYIPQPTELRREESEHLLTILPQETKVLDKATTESVKKTNSQRQAEEAIEPLASAVDFSLIARILKKDITGKTVMYVDHTNQKQLAVVTKPYPLFLKSQTTLSPGWYWIDGTFHVEDKDIIVQVASANLCERAWCDHEE